jgi:hypothetical protein
MLLIALNDAQLRSGLGLAPEDIAILRAHAAKSACPGLRR